MKKNIFDPFMHINFENGIKESKSVEIPNKQYDTFNSSEILFEEKRVNIRVPQIIPGFVVLVSNNSIGENNEVGRELLKNVLLELTDLVDLPECLIFVNNAVSFLEDNIDLIKKIKNLKKFGTKIYVSKESLISFCKSDSFDFATKLSSSEIAKRVVFSRKLLQF